MAKYMDEVEQKLGLENGAGGIMPLIETALGVENAFSIVVFGIAFKIIKNVCHKL